MFNAPHLVAAALVRLLGGPEVPVYVFVPDVDRLVAIDRGEVTVFGKLNRDGEFRESSRVPAGLASGPAHELLNGGGLVPTPVYELRAGVLFPGTMRVGGPFVPEAGGAGVPFAAYKYLPGARRIWNLPGHFRSRPAAIGPPAPPGLSVFAPPTAK